MIIIQNGYSCEYDIRLFAKLFFDEADDIIIMSNFAYEDKYINVYTTIIFNENIYFSDDILPYDSSVYDEKMNKKVYVSCCTKSFCHAASKIRKINLPWGVMHGVRPAKVVRQFEEAGFSRDEIKQMLALFYEADKNKIELAMTVAENEKKLLEKIKSDSVSIYIGIPFCPTRCLYCSFVSTDVRTSGKYMDEYVKLLLCEIEKTAQIMHKINVYAENIYIGGGTPTTLSAEQLCMVFDQIKKQFDLSKVKEFTLEAGRPDTITYEKLIAAKNGGINRISINPQTMNAETLKKVGRTHSPELVWETYQMARKIGFETINMDLIAGLPNETPDMFRYSLDSVIKMNPENITVHVMCIKRAASLRFEENALTEAQDMNEMLGYTQEKMKQFGYEPYYMYRQKNSSGNLENVGYAKKGHMSTYNVNIMEEIQTILALGGGGSTKLVKNNSIKRIFNFKDPYEYIRRFDEILKKKEDILESYKN